MGYDITAYIPKESPTDPLSWASSESLGRKIAFVELGPYDPEAHELLRVLRATDYDGEVSGTGIGRYFTKQEIEIALTELCGGFQRHRKNARVLRFVAQIMEAVLNEPWVYIDFS